MTIDIKCLHLFPSQEIKMFCRAGIALLISTELMIKGQTFTEQNCCTMSEPAGQQREYLAQNYTQNEGNNLKHFTSQRNQPTDT